MDWPAIFAGFAGFVLAVSLLKFGNPVILDHLVLWPTNFEEWRILPWPVVIGQGAVVVAVALAILAALRLKIGWSSIREGGWLLWVPVVWLAWQGLAAVAAAPDAPVRPFVRHFIACVLWFYLGRVVLSRVSRVSVFWGALLIGFALVLWFGFGQHYGGLEATRSYFRQRSDWQQFPPEYLRKLESNRIFSTLVYPNALAGAVLLLLPVSAVFLWQGTGRFLRPTVRMVAVGMLGYMALACLYWSGSKAGWLIALGQMLICFWLLPWQRRAKVVCLLAILAIGLAGFYIRNAGYFDRGATSVSARFDYWEAALQTFRRHPMLGTGPGSFANEYRKIKPPAAEMAKLAHNDYLQQASDSGLVGFAAYLLLVFASLARGYRPQNFKTDRLRFAVWLGLVGWAAQGAVEFGLYIPALAWPAFLFLGWIVSGPDEK